MAVLLYAGIAAGCLLAGRILIHYFQLESYQFPGYFRTLRRNILKAVMPGVLMTALFVVSFAAMSVIAAEFTWFHYLILAAVMVAGGFLTGRKCS